MSILWVKKYYFLNNVDWLIEQAKFTYSSLGKAFEKQIKAIVGQGKKHFEALKVLKSVEHQQKPESIESSGN